MPSEETKRKRKQPPTFRHLPEKRAKKLKQVWVQNKKMKTQWKAQKRKEGLYNTSSRHSDAEEENSGSEPNLDPEDVHSGSELGDDEKQEEQPQTVSPPTQYRVKQQQQPKGRKAAVRQDDLDPDAEIRPSLRELTREAYSRSSLHSFKAKNTRGRGGGAGGRGRSGRGESARNHETRGQPNMKLRMNAMLERIKQTMS